MRRKRLIWQIYPSYLLILVVSFLAMGVFTLRATRAFYLSETRERLDAALQISEREMLQDGVLVDKAELSEACRAIGQALDCRLTAITESGRVVGDSWAEADEMDNHADRPEIMIAFREGEGEAVRFSGTLRRRMMYLAKRVTLGSDRAVVFRAAVPVMAVRETLSDVHGRIVLAAIATAMLAAIVGLVVARRIARPIETIRGGARRFAAGDLDFRLPLPSTREMAGLAETINEMAGRLSERMRMVVRQRNEQGAVLRSMTEGVIAVDRESRIAQANRAAAELIGVDQEELAGKTIEEAVRNVDLQSFVQRAMEGVAAIEGDIVLRGTEERFLQVHGTKLEDADGKRIGALIVLNDVTRLRRLEGMRRDFVANVSHELKTPITSIKGFVETLLDDKVLDPEQTRHFLGIVSRQVNRLNLIINDILSLSAIEEGSERAHLAMEKGRLLGVFKEAVEICEDRAARKNVELKVHCERDVSLVMNAHILEQAIVNLIDNAVKFSPAGSVVALRGRRDGENVRIDVSDNGPGIDKKHLPRLFERFYRIDKGRSRQQGGTGLGLSIVKHVVIAHGGEVSVETEVGKGTTFTLTLPHDGPHPGAKAGHQAPLIQS